jgi:hypothetical protein
LIDQELEFTNPERKHTIYEYSQITESGILDANCFFLSLVTIFYNISEGIVSVFFGTQDDTLALLGFGIDSFVEVISGIGIAHMVYRMRRTDIIEHDAFERRALRITGASFYILTGGLISGVVLSLIYHKSPETTIAGIIIASISICRCIS